MDAGAAFAPLLPTHHDGLLCRAARVMRSSPFAKCMGAPVVVQCSSSLGGRRAFMDSPPQRRIVVRLCLTPKWPGDIWVAFNGGEREEFAPLMIRPAILRHFFFFFSFFCSFFLAAHFASAQFVCERWPASVISLWGAGRSPSS